MSETTKHWRTGGDGVAIAGDGVLVQRDAHRLADLLHLAAREAVRAQVPQHKVVVCAARRQLVTRRRQRLSERVCVGADLGLSECAIQSDIGGSEKAKKEDRCRS
jgi:hypothetical protein